VKPLLYPFVCLALLLGTASAEAATYEQRLIAHLRKLGYGDITLSFTLLGRAQIIAISKDDTREIVLNPRTGEILRDFAQSIESEGVDSIAVAVEPIFLEPEAVAGVVAELPGELAPVEVAIDPVVEAITDVAPDLTGVYVDETPPDAVIPEVPDLTAPAESTPGSEAATSGSTTETIDTGVAP
jgi:hypothetical protein